MRQVYLPTHGGFAHYRIPTGEDFNKIQRWGINKGEPFEEALALLCLERLDGVNIPPYIRGSYDSLRNFSLFMAPDDMGVYVIEVMRATSEYYASQR